MIRLGYPAQDVTLPASTNHSCRLAGLRDAEKVRALVRQNMTDLETYWAGTQFIKPGSPRPEVSERGPQEQRYPARVLDPIGGEDSVIVLHTATAARFVETMRPHKGVLKYLALENYENIWTVHEVVATANAPGVPAIADSFHHALNPGGLTLREALDLALPSWEVRPGRPKLHLCSQGPREAARRSCANRRGSGLDGSLGGA